MQAAKPREQAAAAHASHTHLCCMLLLTAERSSVLQVGQSLNAAVRKMHHLLKFILKTINLPRQARGKHRESTHKEMRFSQAGPAIGNIFTRLSADWFPPQERMRK
jgi:hypothetical protein